MDDIEAKNVNGITYYLVEIETNDGREATVEINAITGQINTLTGMMIDDDDDDDDDDD